MGGHNSYLEKVSVLLIDIQVLYTLVKVKLISHLGCYVPWYDKEKDQGSDCKDAQIQITIDWRIY
jgi:hypothetical protein